MNRKSSQPYAIPDTDIVIDNDTDIVISTAALHRDPYYYRDPEKFDPERFSEASKADPQFSKKPYFPFGDGPRICIGLKLGKIQIKISLAMMLEKYRYELSESMRDAKLSFDPDALLMSPKGGIELNLHKRRIP